MNDIAFPAMNEKQALAYASNILRTLSVQDPQLESGKLLHSARVLDNYAKDMED